MSIPAPLGGKDLLEVQEWRLETEQDIGQTRKDAMWLDMEWKEKTSIAKDAINVCERNPNH